VALTLLLTFLSGIIPEFCSTIYAEGGSMIYSCGKFLAIFPILSLRGLLIAFILSYIISCMVIFLIKKLKGVMKDETQRVF